MNDVVNLGLPAGYRVADTESGTAVECERGCGWRMRITTVSALPSEARERLFRCHEEWHAKSH